MSKVEGERKGTGVGWGGGVEGGGVGGGGGQCEKTPRPPCPTSTVQKQASNQVSTAVSVIMITKYGLVFYAQSTSGLRVYQGEASWLSYLVFTLRVRCVYPWNFLLLLF